MADDADSPTPVLDLILIGLGVLIGVKAFEAMMGPPEPKRGRCGNCKTPVRIGAAECPSCRATLRWPKSATA